MTETKFDIKLVGNYAIRWGEPKDCQRCHNADWGDVLIDGICGHCFKKMLEELRQKINELEQQLFD